MISMDCVRQTQEEPREFFVPGASTTPFAKILEGSQRTASLLWTEFNDVEGLRMRDCFCAVRSHLGTAQMAVRKFEFGTEV